VPHNPIHDHIRAAASRRHDETTRLVTHMLAHCWPGGAHDRTEPVAKSWLRRWRPASHAAPTPVCGCTTGRCTLCN